MGLEMDMQLSNIWIVSGVILGFQINFFSWRIRREIQMEAKGETKWLPFADWMNLLSMFVMVTGVFVLPLFKIGQFVYYAFGLALILLIGYLFALVGHYELYKSKCVPRPPRPLQEMVPFAVTIILGIVYSICYFWLAS